MSDIVSVHTGLKQEDALLRFKSAGAYSIRYVQENQVGLKFPQKH